MRIKQMPTTQLPAEILVILLCCVISACSNEKAENDSQEINPEVPRKILPNVKHLPTRDRSHIEAVLQSDRFTRNDGNGKDKETENILKQLTSIFLDSIKPVSSAYKFNDINRNVVTEGEILAKPLVLFAGPWSTGKSTMINYILGIDDPNHQLHTGAEPTTSDFTVILPGSEYKAVEGLVLATDINRQFSTLEKFGQGFLEKFQGYEMPIKLLEKVTFVDTPGIIENRKQQERGYPYNDVMKWFIDRADLIIVVFDPSKLDVGSELESLFTQLKGRESQIRIILNKADSILTQELMRVYGALFWNLAPLINVTEPPRVYTGSFWSNLFKPNTSHELFLKEEISLLHDLYQTINNNVENKIAFIRQHAYQVRIHALLIDKYLETFNSKNSVFGDSEAIMTHIIEHPEQYNIYNGVLADEYISKHDLPRPELYREFFSINALNMFKPLKSHCSLIYGCAADHLLAAIRLDLPKLLTAFTKNTSICHSKNCNN